tara:strand:- start:2275 stop:3414 length:1140 start_codon:yes stop_codon:yes gene_type:complete
VKLLTSPSDFPSTSTFCYLNAANVSLTYSEANRINQQWFEDLSLNGSNNFTEEAEEEVFKEVHKSAASFINAKPYEIAGGSSATELLCSFAWSYSPQKGENIVSTSSSFPSTVYPWSRVAKSTGAQIRLAKSKNGYSSINAISSLIDQNTSVVCISHTEFSNGHTYDLYVLAELAHKKDAILVVDATQSAGAIPIDVEKDKIDVLVTGAYKWLCAPFGSAFMYIRHNLAKKLNPGLVGFRSHKNMWDLDATRLRYNDDVSKYEFSTLAFGCILGLSESLKYLNTIGIDKIYNYNLFLTDHLIEGLKQLDAKIISTDKCVNRSPIITAKFKNKDSESIINDLRCANIFISQRKEWVRFSPHFYNTLEDIDLVISEIRKSL